MNISKTLPSSNIQVTVLVDAGNQVKIIVIT